MSRSAGAIRALALGYAMGAVGRGVTEEGGENEGEEVRRYLRNAGIPVPAPWCAAFVQYVTDRAADELGVHNPWNDVRREALVADYVAMARGKGWIVPPEEALAGDLACFKFGTDPGRWNHIGIVQSPMEEDGSFRTVEGNTSPGIGATTSEGEREGDGVYRKRRSVIPGRTLFLGWDRASHLRRVA